MKVSADDWVVEHGTYDYELHKVKRVTENTAYYIRWGDREGRIRKEDIVFSGSEKAARSLHTLLASSKSLEADERRKSSDRRLARDAAYIAAAQ